MTWPVHNPEFDSSARPGSITWHPYRGDYGTDHSTDMIAIVEELNCSKGCAHAGPRSKRREFGPGGVCPIIGMIGLSSYGDQIPELDPRDEGPHCRAYTPMPPPVRREKQRGTEPLFPIPPTQET